MSASDSLRTLTEEVQMLREERDAAFRVLDTALGLDTLSLVLDQSSDTASILGATAAKAGSIIRFERLGFYTVQEGEATFALTYAEPAEQQARLEEEKAPLIEDGTLAWTLGRRSPVITTSSRTGRPLVLYELAARGTTLGLFLGVLGEDPAQLLDISLALFRVLLNSAASMLYNLELYRSNEELNRRLSARLGSLQVSNSDLDRQRRELEARNRERTGELLQLNRSLDEEIAKHGSTRRELAESEQHRERLVEVIGDAVFLVDAVEMRILEANRAATGRYGYEHGRIEGLSLSRIMHDPAGELPLRKEGGPALFNGRHLGANGESFPVEVALNKLSSGTSERVVAVVRDISLRYRLEERVTKSECRYRSLFEQAPIPLLEVDASAVMPSGKGDENSWAPPEEDPAALVDALRVVDVNAAALSFFQLHHKEAARRSIPHCFHDNSLGILEAMVHAMTSGSESFQGEVDMKSCGTESVTAMLNCSLLPSFEGKAARFLLSLSDISEAKREEKAIRFLSFHDELTGLYNRRFYEEELHRLNQKGERPLTILMADINGLKMTNDIFGHQAGDGLLRHAAEVMRRVCRNGDVVARWGGDEFIALFPRTDAGEAERMSEAIRSGYGAHSPGPLPLGLAIGYVTVRQQSEYAEDALPRAEERMYRDKMKRRPAEWRESMETLQRMLEILPGEDGGHIRRLAEWMEALARAFGHEESTVSRARRLARYHDIGMIAVNDEILHKPTSLEPEERLEVENHPEIGYRAALTGLPGLAELAEPILSHHEHWDGRGYPRGLSGEGIPFLARLFAVADAYESMTSGRPYRKPLSGAAALEEIRRHSGTQFDPQVVRHFARLLERGGEVPPVQRS